MELSKERSHRNYERDIGRSASRNRRYRQIEKVLLGDWCKLYLKAYKLYFNCPIGPKTPSQWSELLEKAESKMLNVYRYKADVVAVGKYDVQVIEGSVHFKADHVGKLLLNSALFHMTPEYEAFKDLKLRKVAVGCLFDAGAVLLMQQWGVEFRIFQPAYAWEYLASLEKRKRRPSRVMLHYSPTVSKEKRFPYVS